MVLKNHLKILNAVRLQQILCTNDAQRNRNSFDQEKRASKRESKLETNKQQKNVEKLIYTIRLLRIAAV